MCLPRRMIISAYIRLMSGKAAPANIAVVGDWTRRVYQQTSIQALG